MIEKIALVNTMDSIIGFEEKIKVHELGLLHRAYSIFIFNDNNELLIQKRSDIKYHSPSLWSNTCCSHLLSDEDMDYSIHKRLIEEMGFDCNLKFIKTIKYNIKLENNLIENEMDHVFIGFTNQIPKLNQKEVSDFKWISLEELLFFIKIKPDDYTYWLKAILNSIDFQIELQNKEKYVFQNSRLISKLI